MNDTITKIHDAFLNPDILSDSSIIEAINNTIDSLDQGHIRIAEKIDNKWIIKNMISMWIS